MTKTSSAHTLITDRELGVLRRLVASAQGRPRSTGREAGLLGDFIRRAEEAHRDLTDGTAQDFVRRARQDYQHDGEVEIDDDAAVSRSEDGAYVQAWVWIADGEATTSAGTTPVSTHVPFVKRP